MHGARPHVPSCCVSGVRSAEPGDFRLNLSDLIRWWGAYRDGGGVADGERVTALGAIQVMLGGETLCRCGGEQSWVAS
jgi:hypothetical protein